MLPGKLLYIIQYLYICSGRGTVEPPMRDGDSQTPLWKGRSTDLSMKGGDIGQLWPFFLVMSNTVSLPQKSFMKGLSLW